MGPLGKWIPAGVLLLVLVLQLVPEQSSASEEKDAPVVTVAGLGEVSGTYRKSRDGIKYSAFLGVRYANPPKRFELAEMISPWKGTKDASKFGSVCSQFSLYTQKLEGTEDCLYLNVFTPDVKEKYPVFVFIHGGGFAFGNSDENGGDYFMDEKAVLVTINYRVSALGFLSMQDDILPGNLGMKDQLLALKWIKANIHFFGGDPDRVTLFGESAGAASVNYHVLSPASEGLFNQAIYLSGSAVNPWAFAKNPKERALKLAESLNCPSDSAGLKKCLNKKSALEIVQKAHPSHPLEPPCIFVPTTEPPSSHAFLTEDPKVLYSSGRFSKVPLLITAIEKEGLILNGGMLMKQPKLIDELNENWLQLAPKYFYYDHPNVPQDAKDIISKRLKKFYLEDENISSDTFDETIEMYSDSWIIYDVRNAALLHAAHAPVYAAMLAYNNLTWSQILALGYDKPKGMSHADDLPFLFNADKYPKFEPASEQEMVSKYFVKAVVQMGVTGNPKFDDMIKYWKPVSKGEIDTKALKWLYIKGMPTVTEKPFAKRMEFWDSVNKKLKAQALKAGKDEL